MNHFTLNISDKWGERKNGRDCKWGMRGFGTKGCLEGDIRSGVEKKAQKVGFAKYLDKWG